MSMTTELIDRLRQHADIEKSGFAVDGIVNDYREAADTIQLLSEKLHASQMERSSQYYNDGWIPVSERLPKINQRVLLVSDDGEVFIGTKDKPKIIWQVTGKDGKKRWVYDPEAYTDDIDSLPICYDCGFNRDAYYNDSLLSVTSANYDSKFGGIIAWMPLPEPYKEGD